MLQGVPSIITSNRYAWDQDALTFITAASLTDDTEKIAINELVKNAKLHDWWNTCLRIYPFVGSTAASCAVNLKTPGTGNITWAGTPTFASTGVSGWSGTNYGNLNFVPNISNGLYPPDHHISIYSRTNVAENSWDIGTISGTNFIRLMLKNLTGNMAYYACGTVFPSATAAYKAVAVTTSLGLCIGNLNSRIMEIFQNGVSIATKANVVNGTITVATQIGYVVAPASTREYAFASIGASFTPTQVTDFYNDVQAFQTFLNREV